MTVEEWMDSVLNDRCPVLMRGKGIKLSTDHVFKEGRCIYCKAAVNKRWGK